MSNIIDNRKAIAFTFYKSEPLDNVCCICENRSMLYRIKDGYDSIICSQCLHLTLEELEFSEDFYTDDFNKNKQ